MTSNIEMSASMSEWMAICVRQLQMLFAHLRVGEGVVCKRGEGGEGGQEGGRCGRGEGGGDSHSGNKRDFDIHIDFPHKGIFAAYFQK